MSLRPIFFLVLTPLASISHATDKRPARPVLHFESIVSPDAELIRVKTEAVRSILLQQGYDLLVSTLPPKRGLKDLKVGRLDGTMGRLGDLASILQTDLARVNVPVSAHTISRWCRKPLSLPPTGINVGGRMGSMLLMQVKGHFKQSVHLHEFTLYKSIIQMMHSGRLDCLLASNQLLEAEGIDPEDLKDFDHVELGSVAIHIWILKRHEALKEALETGLKGNSFPESYRKRFQSSRPACDGKLDFLCPDGIIFDRKFDLFDRK